MTTNPTRTAVEATVTDNKAFREYATRVSFNISLSRNQIWTLYQISMGKVNQDRDGRIAFGIEQDMFVPGAKWLEQHGLAIWTDPGKMNPAWKDFPWKVTDAGGHLLALLRIAGLIPIEATNNNGVKPRQSVRAAT